MRSAVEASWTTRPLRRVRSRRRRGFRPVTIQGPKGAKVSAPLARHHWRSPLCQVRAETSLPQV
jgi:hypothetical protein